MRGLWRLAIGMAASLAAMPAAGQPRIIHGWLTSVDKETYREVPFDVPAGVSRVTVTLDYDKAERTVVDLGLWDTTRFRGWSGGRRSRITLSETDATPGYLRGLLPSGRWKVVLGVPNIRAGVRAAYTVTIAFDRGERLEASAAIGDAPLRDAPGWYRGDLHMHDAHSDGSCAPIGGGERAPCPLYRTVAAAAAARLDFVAVTDHNTVSHFDALRELQPYFNRTLLIPGVEITTFHGHANVLAPGRFVDFRQATRRGIRALQDDVAATRGLLSINHPALPSGDACMGCGWRWQDTDWSRVAAVEVVNGVNATGPLSGLSFWYDRLNAGHRLTGIAGSDNHDPDATTGQSPVGRPATVVHAQALSTEAILAGIRSGNVFIDVEGTHDRLIEVHGRQGQTEVAMGGVLAAGRDVSVRVRAVAVRGAAVQLIVDGTPAGPSQPVSQDDQAFTLPLARTMHARWFAVTVLRDGKPLLIGNPVYLR